MQTSAICLALIASATAGKASSILDFSQMQLQSLVFETLLIGGSADGVIATFDNPTSSPASGDNFRTSGDTFFVGSGFATNSFDVSFSEDVILTGFRVGGQSNGYQGVDIVGPGLDLENALLGPAPASTDLNVPISFLGGETYSFTEGSGGGATRFVEWRFEAAVIPLPMPAWMLLSGVAGLVALGARGRSA